MRIQQVLASIALAAIMNVAQGTVFLIGVDPATGDTRIMIQSGVGSATRANLQSPPTPNSPAFVYPAQQMHILPGQDGDTDGASQTTVIDIDDFVRNAPASVIEALIRNKADIERENAALMDQMGEQIRAGGGDAGLMPDREDLEEKFKSNLNNLIDSVISKAVEQNKLDSERVRDLLAQTTQELDRRTDLERNMPDRNADRHRQEQMQSAAEQRRRQMEEQKKKQEEFVQRNQEQQDLINEKKRKLEEAKRKAEEEVQKKAAEQLKNRLAESERQRLEAMQKQREQQRADQEGEAARKNAASTSPTMAAGPQQTADTGGTPSGDEGESGTQASRIPGGGGGTGGAGRTATSRERYDPNAPVNGTMLRQLVDGSPLPPIPPRSLANLLGDAMAAQSEERNEPSNGRSGVDDASDDKLLRDFVERAEAPAEAPESFPYIATGDVSALPPTEALAGERSATYSGQLSGAFTDGMQVDGALLLDVDFRDHLVTGSVDFGSNGIADVGGEYPASENRVLLPFHGDIFGGSGNGQLRGEFYGPQGQELGGDWDMHISDPSSEGRNAEGQFATKR